MNKKVTFFIDALPNACQAKEKLQQRIDMYKIKTDEHELNLR